MVWDDEERDGDEFGHDRQVDGIPWEIVCKLQCELCGTKFCQQIPQEQPNRTISLGYARRTVKQWLRKAKLQPFNKALSDKAALIQENSSPTVQRVNSWRLWTSRHGFAALASGCAAAVHAPHSLC